MTIYSTPGVYYQKVDLSKNRVSAVRTDIPGFVGIAEKGPLHKPVRLETWKQFHAEFGGFIPQAYLAYAVKGFFDNGGQTCYVVRIADRRAAKKAAITLQDKNNNATIEISAVNEGQWGNDIKASLKQTSIWSTVTANDYKCNCGYLYNEAREREAFDSLDADWKCPGCKAEKTEFKQITKQPSDGSYSIVQRIRGFSNEGLVKIFQKEGGKTAYCYIKEIDTSGKKIEWYTPLAGFDFNKFIYFNTIEFSLTFSLGSAEREVFDNLSLNPEHERYVAKDENVINGRSRLITVSDLESQSSAEDKLPDPEKIKGTAFLGQGIKGVDGISSITADDFTGVSSSDRSMGMLCYEEIDEVSMICIPDIMIQPVREAVHQERPPAEKPDPCLLEGAEAEDKTVGYYKPPRSFEMPPTFTCDDVYYVQRSMIEHCEKMKDRVAILDSPYGMNLSDIQDWRLNFDSKYSAIYYPWIGVDDPLRIGNQLIRMIPPSGHIAGIYARTDLNVGVHKAPANETILGVKDTDIKIDNALQDVLNPMGINCLRIFPGKGVVVWGARTLSSDTSWRFINIRRLIIMIEEAVEESMQWAVFEPHNFYLRTGITVAVGSFLEELWQKGALAGARKEEAFFIKCSEENNPQEVINEGKVIAEIGVAPSVPAEFIILKIGKEEDSIRIIEDETT